MNERDGATWLDSAVKTYTPGDVAELDWKVHYFGDHVAFDKEVWMAEDDVWREINAL